MRSLLRHPNYYKNLYHETFIANFVLICLDHLAGIELYLELL